MLTFALSKANVLVIPDLFLNMAAVLFLVALLFFLKRIRIEVNLKTEVIYKVWVKELTKGDIGCIAVFDADGENLRFFVPLYVYNTIKTGDTGTLTHQGTKFICFNKKQL